MAFENPLRTEGPKSERDREHLPDELLRIANTAARTVEDSLVSSQVVDRIAAKGIAIDVRRHIFDILCKESRLDIDSIETALRKDLGMKDEDNE